MKYIPEPFKIKMVEPIAMTSREERANILARAHYNMFGLPAESVYIDLLTDSGTGAMSDAQWAAVMRGDEAYSGGRSYMHLMDVAGSIFGYSYIQPVHQGRAAEKVLMPLLVSRPGQLVMANTFFDTTRAHVGLAGGRPVDNVCSEGLDSAKVAPFKGNMDVAGLEKLIAEHGDDIAAIVMTVTNNSVGGQPVSLQNMRETYEVAHKYAIPVCLDAARYAENAYFIHEREEGCQDRSLRDIVAEMFRYGDMFVMSAKKDAIVNMGGLLGVREDGELAEKVKSNVISFEGYLTYGGDWQVATWKRWPLASRRDSTWTGSGTVSAKSNTLATSSRRLACLSRALLAVMQYSSTPVACCRIWSGNSTQGTRSLPNCTWMQEFDPATSVLTLWTGTPLPRRSNRRPSSSLG